MMKRSPAEPPGLCPSCWLNIAWLRCPLMSCMCCREQCLSSCDPDMLEGALYDVISSDTLRSDMPIYIYIGKAD